MVLKEKNLPYQVEYLFTTGLASKCPRSESLICALLHLIYLCPNPSHWSMLRPISLFLTSSQWSVPYLISLIYAPPYLVDLWPTPSHWSVPYTISLICSLLYHIDLSPTLSHWSVSYAISLICPLLYLIDLCHTRSHWYVPFSISLICALFYSLHHLNDHYPTSYHWSTPHLISLICGRLHLIDLSRVLSRCVPYSISLIQ